MAGRAFQLFFVHVLRIVVSGRMAYARLLQSGPLMRPSEKLHFGLAVERRAEEWLLAGGARVLARNFRYRGGEIDLVIEENDPAIGELILVFVEVKARGAGSWGQGACAVDTVKARRIERGTRAFLARYRGNAVATRIDVLVWSEMGWERFGNFWSEGS